MIVTSLQETRKVLEEAWGNTAKPRMQFSLLISKMAEAMEMAAVLKNHNLGNLTEVFTREKITPDIVSLMSASEMKQLGVNSREDMMKLRIECSTYGRFKPRRQRETIIWRSGFLHSTVGYKKPFR